MPNFENLNKIDEVFPFHRVKNLFDIKKPKVNLIHLDVSKIIIAGGSYF